MLFGDLPQPAAKAGPGFTLPGATPGIQPKPVLFNDLPHFAPPAAATSTPDNGGPVGSFISGMNRDAAPRAQKIADAVVRPVKIASQGGSPLAVTKAVGEAGLNTAGQTAGYIGDAIGEGLKAITPQPVQDFLSHGVSSLMNDSSVIGSGKSVGDITGAVANNWTNFAAKHPQAATDLGSVFNIGALLAGSKASQEAAPAVAEGVQNAVQGAKDVLPALGKTADEKAAQATWDMVKPELTKTEQAQAVTEGRIVSKGPLGTVEHIPQPGKLVNGVLQPSRDMQMVEAARPYVTPAKNEIQAISNMQRGIAQEATKLKAGLNDTGAIYSKSQVAGALAKLEPPTMIASDATLNKAYGLVKARMLSLVGQGGKLGDLLDARRNFDAFVSKQFPNLYNSDTLTPMRSAVKDIRGALNDTIDSRLPNGTLPDGTNFRNSLRKQSLLYDAIDNVAPKVPKVGSNKVIQWAKDHPTATKLGLTAVGTGIGVEAGKGVLGL